MESSSRRFEHEEWGKVATCAFLCSLIDVHKL